jgi:hypothetical protein
MIAVAGLVLTALALVVSLGLNYLQYKWRKVEREQVDRDKAIGMTSLFLFPSASPDCACVIPIRLESRLWSNVSSNA